MKAMTRVTRGNQVTIPKAVRYKTGLKIDDLLEVDVDEDQVSPDSSSLRSRSALRASRDLIAPIIFASVSLGVSATWELRVTDVSEAYHLDTADTAFLAAMFPSLMKPEYAQEGDGSDRTQSE